MKLNDLIKSLQELKAEFGNQEVLVAGDPAGNFYSDLGKILSFDVDNGKILVFPEKKVWADEL